MCQVRFYLFRRLSGAYSPLRIPPVMLQALKEEPPLNTKCKDKFLIQSTIITPDKETLALSDIVGIFLRQRVMRSFSSFYFKWASPEANEDGRVFQQKLRVTYLPAEGPALEEEDENVPVGMMSVMSANDSVSDRTFSSYASRNSTLMSRQAHL